MPHIGNSQRNPHIGDQKSVMNPEPDQQETRKILDLGCGPSKVPGAWGVDLHQYAEVDQVLDMNDLPWDLPSNRFKTIYAHHVIEHVSSVIDFMNEIHRVAKPNTEVHIVTPHFSSIDSYKDPTHLRHIASGWYTIFTESYLQEQIPQFALVSSEVTFGASMLSMIPQLLIRLKSVEWWEKKLAFVFRARNVKTILRVVKE